jgi:hypothetical protein
MARALLWLSAAGLAGTGCGGSDQSLVLVNLRAEGDVPKVEVVKVQVGNQEGIWAQQEFAGDPPRAGEPLRVGVYVREGLSGPIAVVAIAHDGARCEVGRGTATGALPAKGSVTIEVLLKRSGACGAGASAGGMDAGGGGARPDAPPVPVGPSPPARDGAADVVTGDASADASVPALVDAGPDAQGDAGGDAQGDAGRDASGDVAGMLPMADRPVMSPSDVGGGAPDVSAMPDAAIDAVTAVADAPAAPADQVAVAPADAAPDQAVTTPQDAEVDASLGADVEPDLAPTPDAEDDAAPDAAEDAAPDVTLSLPDMAVTPDVAPLPDAPPPPPDMPPGMCNHVAQAGCGGGEKCSAACNLNPPPPAVLGCVANAASPVPIGGICNTTADCVGGAHCIVAMGNTRKCHKYCNSNLDCPAGSTTGVCRWEITCSNQRTGIFLCDLP